MKLALLGRQVESSLSPAIFAAAFKAAGITGTYESRSVDEAGVRSAFDQLRTGALDGVNVTMPHKALAFALCDRVEPDAGRAGSVNTIVREGGERVGYSTDIDGIRECWTGLETARPVLILGGGGAAAAALVALAAHEPYIATRSFGDGTEIGARTGVAIGEVHWGVPVVGANVVNCTPLGMNGEMLPEPVLELADGLFDMAYGSSPTPAVRFMRDKGRAVVDGIDLLVSQAGYGFRLFTGREPPLTAMRTAVKTPKAN